MAAASEPADGIFDTAFLPRGVGIAEVGFEWQAVMMGELDAIIEGDALPAWLRQ